MTASKVRDKNGSFVASAWTKGSAVTVGLLRSTRTVRKAYRSAEKLPSLHPRSRTFASLFRCSRISCKPVPSEEQLFCMVATQCPFFSSLVNRFHAPQYGQV